MHQKSRTTDYNSSSHKILLHVMQLFLCVGRVVVITPDDFVLSYQSVFVLSGFTSQVIVGYCCSSISSRYVLAVFFLHISYKFKVMSSIDFSISTRCECRFSLLRLK